MICALISAARLPVRQPSSTITTRCVFATDASTVSMSSGRSERRSITSALDALGGELLGRLERLPERAAVGDEGHVARPAAAPPPCQSRAVRPSSSSPSSG